MLQITISCNYYFFSQKFQKIMMKRIPIIFLSLEKSNITIMCHYLNIKILSCPFLAFLQ